MSDVNPHGDPLLPPPPSPDEWRRLEPLLDRLLDTPLDQRAALLAEIGRGDPGLRTALERLVAECERGYPLLERTAADRFATVFGDDAPVLPEVLAGRYHIVREVGRGGMAIVYLARDAKHGRDVAVKVVRPGLAAFMGRARFLREIEIAAGLRHPHIVPLYDSGEIGSEPTDTARDEAGSSLLYYVMPYEPGQSLRERLVQEQRLTVADTVAILRDVCEALAHAHKHGIVHRDIKPENVLLSGRHAMVTDFGIARALSEATAEASPGHAGAAFGTPAYMAPEQAANDPHVDHRADLHAVGVLAYELLTGHLPSDADIRAAARRDDEPDATRYAFPGDLVPEALAVLIAKCLAPRPDDRWQSADQLLTQLAAIAVPPQRAADARPPRRIAKVAAAGVAVAAAAILAIALAAGRGRDRGSSLALGHASQLTFKPGLEVQPSLSPDGRQLAYASGNSLQMQIEVRPVAGGRTVRLTTDTSVNEWAPRWSPDGERILFLARGGVFSAPASGGPVREDVASRHGAIVTSAAWSSDGSEIAYVRGDSLLARAVGSRDVRLITTGIDLHSCVWSPDGNRIACVSSNSFFATVGSISGVGPMFGNLAASRIVLIPATGGAAKTVTDSTSLHQSPAWSPDGRTLYYVSNRHGPRDIYALDVGARTAVEVDPRRITTGLGAHSVTFSGDGTRVVYAAYASSANVWSMPIPSDHPVSPVSLMPVTSGNQTVEGVRVSSDGRWLIYDSNLSGSSDVYRVPIEGGDAERLTKDLVDEFRGALSPDGTEMVYHSYRTGLRNLFLLELEGGAAQQLTWSPGQHSLANWSPDGNALTLFDIGTARVLVMRRDSQGRWSAPRFTGGTGWRPEWSPDGRTIVYVSPTDGRIRAVPADSGMQRDLYVPGIGDPQAELAIFAPSGQELYFKSHDAHGRAAFWSIGAAGGRPRLLARFDDPARASNRFEFASDGRRFYFTVEDRQSDIWIAEVAGR